MQKYFTLILLTVSSSFLFAQTPQLISCGAGYNKQSYVRLSDDTEKQVNNDAWDLAFTAFGFQDAGIFINESAGSTMGQNLPQTELHYANTSDFGAEINLTAITDTNYLNSELSWNYGAFNETRITTSPFDYGWGSYNPMTQSVVGNKVFVLKLRNGIYKKIKIESLVGTIYTIRYSNLDGSSEIVKTLNKVVDNKGQKLIFFSFTTNETVDVLPAGGYDFMYGRYISIATDPNGTIQQLYNVTGVLTGPGIQVAEADGVDPATVTYAAYINDFSSKMDVIGFDWKTLVGTSWALDEDKVFFVKTIDNKVWKLHFFDFEGSPTGNAVFEKTDLGIFSSSDDVQNIEAGIFPNPVQDQLFIGLDAKELTGDNLMLQVTDINGQLILNQKLDKFSGFKMYDVNTSVWTKGMYLVRLTSDGLNVVSKKVVKI
ncbi:MAG TPA: HmuY family protein [Saprospiraceae bacterium]|nr:HmuY family protein [Saprospiraceae bacterium]HMU02180.1 HmuY family protein [Saprospiraceae bacterium]